jgi:hypothetical protein
MPIAPVRGKPTLDKLIIPTLKSLVVGFVLLGLLQFLPACTLNYWQALIAVIRRCQSDLRRFAGFHSAIRWRSAEGTSEQGIPKRGRHRIDVRWPSLEPIRFIAYSAW